MQVRRLLLLGSMAMVMLGLPVAVQAQCTFVQQAADGVPSEVYFINSASTPFTHTFSTFTGHSYFFEVKAQSGAPTTGDYAAVANRLFCPGADAAGLRNVQTISPYGTSGGVAWIAKTFTETSNTFMEIKVTTPSASTVGYRVLVKDTTMFSPAWSTNGTFDTFYSFMNTTNGTCNVALTMFDTGGTVRTTFAGAVTTGATASVNTVSLGTARNFTGTARLSHDCPPGGILAEADVANFTLNPPYIQIVKFQPMF